MANEFVLQYHMMRCPGAKKRPSVDSASAGGDPERKKVRKSTDTDREKTDKTVKRGGEDVKNIENAKWWGGDLKDIYTDRKKKKVDYLEVSDIEDSDEDGEKSSPKHKKNLKQESQIPPTSEDDSDVEESPAKKKVEKKKPVKETAETKVKKPQATKSIAVQIFKGKRMEESSDEDATVTQPSTSRTIETEKNKKRKSDVLPASEEPLSPKPKVNKKPPTKKKEKMVTSDSEPEIVKKDMIKIEDDSEEKSAALAEHDLLSSKIREKLLSNKSEKVKCENCNKSLKNSIILQYHQLHCSPVPKSKVPTSPSLSAVEKKIIDSKKSTASPVDMILKKLTEKVHTTSSPVSPVSSATTPASGYKFFKTKATSEKIAMAVNEVAKVDADDGKLGKKNIKELIKTCHDHQISVNVKKISKSDCDVKSPIKSPKPNLVEKKTAEPIERKAQKKPTNQEQPQPIKNGLQNIQKEVLPTVLTKELKQNVKVEKPKPIPEKKKTSTVSSDSDSPRKTKTQLKNKRKSYTEDSDSDEDSEFEVNTKKKKPTQYCFETCFEKESDEMIGWVEL